MSAAVSESRIRRLAIEKNRWPSRFGFPVSSLTAGRSMSAIGCAP